MKVIIFDASTLITLAMNGMFQVIRDLKKSFNGKFIIPREVYSEIVEKPIKNKKFELEALRMKKLVDERVLEFPNSVGVKDADISEKIEDLLDVANSTFVGRGKNIHIIDLGEAAVVVLSRILDEKKIQNVAAIDERTTRVMCERPDKLVKLLRRKLHANVTAHKENFKKFGSCKIIRSTELIYIAYKKGFINLKDPRALDALLWAMRFKGCSISNEEIKEIKKLG